MQNKKAVWFQMLSLIDKLNRSIKEPGWSFEDKEMAYKLKDKLLNKLLVEKLEECEITLYYVPYLRYSDRTKDLAGDLMRRDGRKYSFEYYLTQIEPTAADVEDPTKAIIEVLVKCSEQVFSLHMPVGNLPDGYNAAELPKKKWIPSSEFHHNQLEEAKEQFDKLWNLLDE